MSEFIPQDIPYGKFRVIGVDPFNLEDYVYRIKDCLTTEEAFRIADDHNRQRTGLMDIVYHVYDSQNNFLRGEESIENA